MRQVILYPGEDGYWVVECPSLPGCFSQGKTKDEALINIKDAIQLWIDDAIDHNELVPEDFDITLERV
jgi:predicted RNase H-like HicB family nuclease